MKASWERVAADRAKFEVEVPAERVSRAFERAYRKLVQRVNIPGFRRGKAPRPILERYIGKGALAEEALDEVLPEAYGEAVRQSGLDPIDRPQLDVEKIEDGEPLVFKAEVPVKPEVELGPYRDLEIERETPRVTEEDVAAQLELLAERQTQLVTHDGPAEPGHFVVIDFKGFVDGQPFEGGEAKEYLLPLGRGTFIPGFEDQLIGVRAGEEREVRVTFPADYGAVHLAGKEATFQVKVHEVKRREKPAIDDELARGLGRFQSLQELRADLTNRLQQAADEAANRLFEGRIVEKVAAASKVEPPEVLVHRRIHGMIDDLFDRVRSQGVDPAEFLQSAGKTSDDLHREFHEPARQAVKVDLVLEAIAKREGLTVADDEVRAEIERSVRPYGPQAEAMRRLLLSPDRFAAIREALLRDKARRHLGTLQKPVEKVVSAREVLEPKPAPATEAADSTSVSDEGQASAGN